MTIARITPTSGQLTIFWGDGDSTVVAAGDLANHAHAYAGAGTWTITATPASRITQLRIFDPLLSGFHSAQLRGNAMTDFLCSGLGNAVASVIDSADMVAWPSPNWILSSMPAGGTYSINSTDMAAWTPTLWWLYTMPAGTYNIDTSDMVAWSPDSLSLYSMPAGTYTFAAGIMANWTRASSILVHSLLDGGVNLTQADVDGILLDVYGSLATRVVINGIINVGGTSAAPSGIFQAAAACPVGALTPGKEIANELLNDGCATGGNTWAFVIFTP